VFLVGIFDYVVNCVGDCAGVFSGVYVGDLSGNGGIFRMCIVFV
jgi:hypothetical protein